MSTANTFSLIYLSGVFVTMIFILMIYTGVKEKVYLLYMLYLTFQVMYSLTVIDLNPISRLNIIYYYPIIEQIFPEIVIFTFIGFYVFFIIILFEIYRNPLLKKVATSLA